MHSVRAGSMVPPPWRSWAKRTKYRLSPVSRLIPEASSAPRPTWPTTISAAISRTLPRQYAPTVQDDELIPLYSRSQVSLGFLEVYRPHDASR